MNKEIKQQSDDLIARLKSEGVEINGLIENDILNALTCVYMSGQNEYLRNNLKAVRGIGSHG